MPALPPEDVLAIDAIPGNVVAGFNKDHQRFLFLRLADRRAAKRWLAALVPQLATTREVLAYNDLFRLLRKRHGADPQGFVATWIHVAFSHAGLRKLTSVAEAKRFADRPFAEGPARRAVLLGDPANPTTPGHPVHWAFGGPDTDADVLVIVASDDREECDAAADRIIDDLIVGHRRAADVVHDQRGDTLGGDLRGHEHFGFRDGISQPGVRGRLSEAAGNWLTPRGVSSSAPDAPAYAKPGQPLVWPGQFVLGYRRQRRDDPQRPAPARRTAPAWARDGSFVVVRKLAQDVAGFWRFAFAEAGELAQQTGFRGMSAERLAALMIGRWKSGAPVALAPRHDDPALAADPSANNRFGYAADANGAICPYAAHVRRMNPRDLATAEGGAADTLTRLVLRRGIPYGPPIANPLAPTRAESRAERGLMYVSYQASIGDQFEFLSAARANRDESPEDGGPDALIGQHDGADGRRLRRIMLVGAGGRTATIELPRDWIHAAGGGYFFAPSLAALAVVLAR
ncbi:MAG: Dyp-type peroxidase [Betaproteobacteria bacterium]